MVSVLPDLSEFDDLFFFFLAVVVFVESIQMKWVRPYNLSENLQALYSGHIH